MLSDSTVPGEQSGPGNKGICNFTRGQCFDGVGKHNQYTYSLPTVNGAEKTLGCNWVRHVLHMTLLNSEKRTSQRGASIGALCS